MVIIGARGTRRVLTLYACVFQFRETDPNGTSSRWAAVNPFAATVMMDISIAICKHMASESGIIVPDREHALVHDCDHLIASFYVE